jgi:hypothetical protein
MSEVSLRRAARLLTLGSLIWLSFIFLTPQAWAQG